MDAVKNPYAPGAGNPPPELAGRADVLEKARTTLLRIADRKPVQFPILIGLRGVGKTVLLVKSREIAEANNFLTIDIEAHEGKSLAELIVPGFRKCLYALSAIESGKDKARRGIRVLRGFLSALKVTIGDVEFGISVDPEAGVADSGDLEADLPEMMLVVAEAAAAAGRPVAIIFDELQYLSSGEFSALIMGMHKINQRGLPLALVGAGLPQILGLAGNSKSYSERLFTYPKIGALSIADAISAIVNPARAEGVSFSDDAISLILETTGRYPYFVQQWAHDAWNVATGPEITKDDVDKATLTAIRTLDESFFRVRFDRCTPAEKKYMRALAELGAGPHRSADIADKLGVKSTSVAPTRNNLLKKGMIYSPSYGDTAFTVPLFDEYMRREIPHFTRKMEE